MGMRYRFNHTNKENEKLVTKTFTILFYRLGWSFGCSYLYPRSTSVCVERTFLLREGCTNENPEKVWSFAKPPSDPWGS